MKILFITQYFAPEIGAAPVRLTALADELRVLGHEVSVVTSMPNYPTGRTFRGYRRRLVAREQTSTGVDVHRIWTVPATGSGLARYINYLSFMAAAPLLIPTTHRPDVIVVESPPLTTAVIGWLYATRFGAPTVLHIADPWPDAVVDLGLVDESSLQVALARRLERWSYRQATLVSFASHGIAERLRTKGISEDRLVFLANGADLERFAPQTANPELIAELGLEGRQIVLFAGTHSVAAGMDVLIDTAEALRDDESIAILLVGDGPAKAPLIAEACERGLSNLVFIDPVSPERVADLYNLSVAGLVTMANRPALHWMRPAKMFPPLSCGKPVVFSGRGEAADLVEENGMGVVVAPGDAPALAQAIRAVVSDPAGSAAMGGRGRRFIEDHMSWADITVEWMNSIEERLQ
jgi:colanic acid biosynthesis glycosyl transferase WcaI